MSDTNAAPDGWPTDRVRVILEFDDEGCTVTRRPEEGAPVTTERIDLNATENGGTLIVRTSGKVGYVFVVQKWEEPPLPRHAEDDDRTCFIDACINCGDGARHGLMDDQVEWDTHGDALCPECEYDRGVYGIDACGCETKAPREPMPMVADENDDPKEDTDAAI